MNFKVTFHLDGTGLYFDANEPIHLDALLAWVLAPKQNKRHLERSEEPSDISLPLKRYDVPESNSWVWHASALIPDDMDHQTILFWRKRFRQSKAELTIGSPNLTNATYRDWQSPLPLLLTHKLTAYASGSRCDCKKLLKEVKYLGRKRAHGYGKIIGIDFDEMEEDRSVYWEGKNMRWVPNKDGTRLVRPRPPYWHPFGAVQCLDV